VDTIAPNVTITSPSNITYTTVKVTVYATNDTHVDEAWYRFKNDSWSMNYSMIYDPIDLRWEIEDQTYNNGSYYIQVFFNDSVGNEAHSSVTFTVFLDTLPPLISLETLNNESILTSNTPIVVITTDSNLDTVLVNWDGQENQTWTFPYETYLPEEEIEHVLYVYANDTSDNWISKKYVFLTDDTFPEISLKTVTDLAVDLNVSDDHLDTVLYNWNNEDNQTFYTPYQVNLPPSEGYHTLYVYATDSAGNSALISILIIVDGTLPEINLLNPKNGSILPSGSEIVYNVTDNHLETVLFNWDSTQNNSVNSLNTAILPEGEGDHTLYIFANDSVGHWSQTIFVFTTDDIKPDIKLLDHLNMSTLPSNTIITLEVNDTNLDIVICSWDGSQDEICVSFRTVLPEGEGEHILYVYANDTAGNWVVVQFVFYSSDEDSLTTEGSDYTQTIMLPGEITAGVILSALFVSIGLIARRLFKRRFSSSE